MYVEKGMNIKAIAKQFNSSSRTISNKLKEAGIDVVNSSALRRINSQVVLSLFKQGISVDDIAELNSKSHDNIKLKLEESGVNFLLKITS